MLSSTDGDLALTPCLGANLYDGDIGYGRRVALPHPDSYATHNRRLISSWGPHWMCEEFWLGGIAPVVAHDEKFGANLCSLYPALRICKRMSV